MILDDLDSAERYSLVHPGFTAAFEFLKRDGLEKLAAGRHPIDGDRLYALVIHQDGRGRENAKLEIHRRYIDIQFTVAGRDEIGWKPVAQCTRHGQEYNEEKDVAFFTDEPDAWVATPKGTFGVFFPEDAHAPLGGTGPIHKVVVKVAVEW